MVILCFVLSVGVLWLQATVYPELPILAFAPFLALVSLDVRPVTHLLLWSCGAGLTLDLLSSDPLGSHALIYTLSVFAAGRLKQLFSSETPLQFAMYTTLMSATATLLQLILLFLFDRRASFAGRWFVSEALCLPVFDGVAALLWFAGPFALYRKAHTWWTLHWLKKKNIS
jgi:rod shape-determining protein MreD